ncbi:hypothetical protein KO481_20545 [Nocardia sp. NEAU-G5]|uniref:Uncharacterized protein n=1 Tax=Nocardia albiluteola TaxID=2842303 RepID=A0ABS6B182_9NOCA|nr:hypothetical protein [Nocardia albiluteola]MBU3063908.1 hypothetical protein [Nocardia albiluteola]
MSDIGFDHPTATHAPPVPAGRGDDRTGDLTFWIAASAGALGGLAGGLVFGGVMLSIGFLPTVAAIVRTDSAIVGFVVHMLFAAVIGAGFGILVARQERRIGELLSWGLVYGALWWLLGPLTLLPLFLGRAVRWDVATAQGLLPSLVGHLLYGAVTAMCFALLTRRRRADTADTVDLRTAAIAVLSGAVTGTLLAAATSMAAGGYSSLFVGVLAGAGYPLLFGVRGEGTGPGMIRGVAYGFVWWIVAGLTLPSLLSGYGLDWSVRAARHAVPTLPGYLLLGVGIAVVFGWLMGLVRAVSSDALAETGERLRGNRVTGVLHGILAGLVGGVVFTGVMVAIGFLPRVAALLGSGSAGVGIVVHLIISVIIGIGYAVWFRGRSFDPASGLGWGVSYGFLWWVLGYLTLLPLLLGHAPVWSPDSLAAGFPSLVGHLGYGAALGLVYQRLEQRVSPWYLTRSEVAAERARARYRQILGSAPALWSLVVLIAVLMPVLVG